jgi:hypothetical protein
MMYAMTPKTLGPLLLACLLVLQDVQAFSPAARSQSLSTTSVAASSSADNDDMIVPTEGSFSRRTAVSALLTSTAVVAAGLLGVPETASARLEPINKPELLPAEKGVKVIQTEKFLTAGQVKRLDSLLTATERDTGYRVRVLCQAYPNTPGLAIRDYWDLGKEGQIDDKYIVLVVDQFGGKGNVLNFNVGEGVKFALPNVFWTRLQAKFGTVRAPVLLLLLLLLTRWLVPTIYYCLFGSFTYRSLTFLSHCYSTSCTYYLVQTVDILRPRQRHRLVHHQCY